MYGMTGIGGERVFGSFTGSVRRRLPWLSLNLATTFLAALVIVVFESTLVKTVAIAAFLPVVAGQGGIAGTQTLTLVVRSMALGDVPPRTAVRLVRDELALGLLHGLLVGVVVGLAAFGWKGSYMLGVIVGVALAGNMVVAGAMVLQFRLYCAPYVGSCRGLRRAGHHIDRCPRLPYAPRLGGPAVDAARLIVRCSGGGARYRLDGPFRHLLLSEGEKR